MLALLVVETMPRRKRTLLITNAVPMRGKLLRQKAAVRNEVSHSNSPAELVDVATQPSGRSAAHSW